MTQVDIAAAEAVSSGSAGKWAWKEGLRVSFRGQVPKTAVVATAVGLVMLARFGPLLPGLSFAGQTVLGVFAFFILCTATSALPGPVVGLTAPMLVVVLAHEKLTVAFSAFDGKVFFLALGAFVIAAVMMATPLGRRTALFITGLCNSSKVPRILSAAMGGTVFLHAVLPTVSETALFLPVAQGLSEIPPKPGQEGHAHRTNTAFVLTIAGLTPLFAGPLFLTGAFPNLMLTDLLNRTAGIQISWFSWFLYNLPLWGLLPVLFVMSRRWFRLKGIELADAKIAIPQMRAELGPITWAEIWAIVCVTSGFVLWITGPITHLSTGMVALLVVGMLFLPFGGLDFGKVAPQVMWGVLMLLGGAISLGNLLFKTGVVKWMSQFLVEPIRAAGIHSPVLVLLAVVFGLHVARAGVVSAVATGAAFIPLTIGLAKGFHFSVLPFSLIVTNALNYAVFLPISITAVLIAFSASKMRWVEAVRFGTLLSIVANIYVVVVQSTWLDILGMPLR